MSTAQTDATAVWQGIEVRHLVALREVARAGSISAAADQLGYTQSAVSQQIAVLERLVGVALFHRPGGPRPVSLTEAGSTLLGHAEAVLDRLQEAGADLDALAGGRRGRLAVGTVQSVGARVLPLVLREFRPGWPGVDVTLEEAADDDDLLVALARGDLDVAFVELPTAAEFDHVPLLDDPFVGIVPADHPASSTGTATLASLAAGGLIGYRNAGSQHEIERRLGAIVDDTTFVFRSDDNRTIQGCVGAGLAAAVVPLLTVEPDDPEVAVVALADEVPPRRLALAWRRDRRLSPAAAAFRDVAAAVCQRLQVELTRRAP